MPATPSFGANPYDAQAARCVEEVGGVRRGSPYLCCPGPMAPPAPYKEACSWGDRAWRGSLQLQGRCAEWLCTWGAECRYTWGAVWAYMYVEVCAQCRCTWGAKCRYTWGGGGGGADCAWVTLRYFGATPSDTLTQAMGAVCADAGARLCVHSQVARAVCADVKGVGLELGWG